MDRLTPDLLLRAYRIGLFPMADDADAKEIYWVEPRMRGIFPLENFHISRSLARLIRRELFTISTNTDFGGVMDGCAARDTTWINKEIHTVYRKLHALGHAHSLEVWEGDALVGGVYGVAIGGCFCGESMFSRRRDASKLALAYLVDHLRRAGFVLFDTQFITPHLASLGAIEISQQEYRRQLSEALKLTCDFRSLTEVPSGHSVVQRNTQTS
ncbi:leucyl/phenylalanyl-tRNA--protein transferase [Vannielia litorea]|uniref:Leucyl/phenylalanyl-tRNA--protein transferase n=1 Tax=Vannielia litorea TaxID=1217970 RepID=A0A1N6G5N5_9RHOB|nr:leucyl/phenylalanyl-tRNA--protein transferase [Vannielia litorea]SIO02771.1 leucyl/phenylalanyl-tRNA--protein transferase [Vannielia litorea]